MRRIPRPSRRRVANELEWLAGGTSMEQAKKRGKQPEGETNKAIAKWRAYKHWLVLERNKRRLATPVGSNYPIELGWLYPGSADWIGWHSVVVTPEMVGKRVAIFCGLEAKSQTGTTSDDQDKFLLALKEAGGIGGVVRNAQDAEDVLKRWRDA